MKNILYILSYLNLKTLIFNFKFFPIKVAIKLPIFINKNVVFHSLKGKIILPQSYKTGGIKIGFGEVGIFDQKRSKTILEINGNLKFIGNAKIGHGSKISIGKAGCLTIGENFIITAETSIICFHAISIGNNSLFSWNVEMMDTDFHKIFVDGSYINPNKAIVIGNNVWIASGVKIMKGVTVANGCVIGAETFLHKSFVVDNCLIAGNPAKVLKENISWEV